MANNTADIRNLALVGQAGAGKTLLAEALLFDAGAIRAKGSLARGTTVCDYDPQEKKLQHSLDAAICTFEAGDTRINLIDTPGFPDFVGRSLSVLEAVETAAVVVSAIAGVDPVTQRMMDFAKERELCRLVDHQQDRQPRSARRGHARTGARALRPRVPAAQSPGRGRHRRSIDCFFQPRGGPTDFGSVEAAHTEIIDQVVELDDELMALYLEQGEELNPEQLHDPFERALREGHLVPVCFVSAETGAGVHELLDIIRRLMPNPAEGNPPPFLKGEGDAAERVEVKPDPGAARDRARLQGHGRSLRRQARHLPHSPGHGAQRQPALRRRRAQAVQGRAPLPHAWARSTRKCPAGMPGDICAVAKVDELHFDAVLHDSHDEDQFHLKSIAFPPPMLGVAIEPERRGEEQRLSDACTSSWRRIRACASSITRA